MSQIKHKLISDMTVKLAALFCCCCVVTVFFSFTVQLPALLFLVGIPLFCSYLSVDTRYTNIAALVNAFLIMILFIPEISIDIVCNIILPTVLIGNLFVKNIKKNNKIWWFPESILLKYLAILMLFISLFLVCFYFYFGILRYCLHRFHSLFTLTLVFFKY